MTETRREPVGSSARTGPAPGDTCKAENAPRDGTDADPVPRAERGAPPVQPRRVIIDSPPTMSLLGLLLGSLVERRAADPGLARRIARLRGDVVVEAGKMVITLAFRDGQVTVSRGASDHPRAQVSGSMDALLRIALGGGMVGPWLAGRIRTRGNLLLLLRMMPLLKA